MNLLRRLWPCEDAYTEELSDKCRKQCSRVPRKDTVFDGRDDAVLVWRPHDTWSIRTVLL